MMIKLIGKEVQISSVIMVNEKNKINVKCHIIKTFQTESNTIHRGQRL